MNRSRGLKMVSYRVVEGRHDHLQTPRPELSSTGWANTTGQASRPRKDAECVASYQRRRHRSTHCSQVAAFDLLFKAGRFPITCDNDPQSVSWPIHLASCLDGVKDDTVWFYYFHNDRSNQHIASSWFTSTLLEAALCTINAEVSCIVGISLGLRAPQSSHDSLFESRTWSNSLLLQTRMATSSMACCTTVGKEGLPSRQANKRQSASACFVVLKRTCRPRPVLPSQGVVCPTEGHRLKRKCVSLCLAFLGASDKLELLD